MVGNIKSFLLNMPAIKILTETQLWKSFRYRTMLYYCDRKNSTYTQFMRLPSQFDALCSSVLDFLLADRKSKNIKIVVMGCSNGAEAYSIASTMKNHHPNLAFTVNAYDIDKEMIDKAKSASYTHEEIFNSKTVTVEFVNDTFYMENGLYKIKKEIARNVYFNMADVLDSGLKEIIGTFDIAYAQNFLVHMWPKSAIKAFNNICLLLNSKAALFIDGMDLNIRQKLTRRKKLGVLEYKIKEIHEEARQLKGDSWPYVYWGLEPFSVNKKDWKRRYSTIFLKMEK